MNSFKNIPRLSMNPRSEKEKFEKKEENLPIQNSVASINKEIEKLSVLSTNRHESFAS